MNINKNMTYLEFVDFLIEEIDEYEKVNRDDWKYAHEMIKKVGSNGDAGMCADLDLIFEAYDEKMGEIESPYSAYTLTQIMSISVVKLAHKGYLNYAMKYMDFLKRGLFKQSLYNRNIGFNMVEAVYKAHRIDNTPVYESGIFDNIFKKREPNDYFDYVQIDSLFLSKTLAEFFLKKDKNNYFSEEERTYLEKTITDYNNFRLYAEADYRVILPKYRDDTKYSKKIPDSYTYKKEAEELLAKSLPAWPAMGYALAEVYHLYERRVAIAKSIVPNPQIALMRSGLEEQMYKADKKSKAFIKSTVKLIATLAITAFVIFKVHALFVAHPEYLGFTAIAVVVFMLLTSINPFTLLFIWLFGD